ncbi:MAG: hypothetical protein OXP09_16215 [Gammaproteobacteria bacterium]|nr:hypothetical protein [Gammaproteobacteria bacterium]
MAAESPAGETGKPTFVARHLDGVRDFSLEFDRAAYRERIRLRIERRESLSESHPPVQSGIVLSRPTDDDSQEIEIPDPVLREELRVNLRKTHEKESITKADLQSLTALTLASPGITDLTGLEFATNLELLNMGEGLVSDLSPLSGLKVLKMLIVESNLVSNLAPLADLVTLEELGLPDNNVSDISLLAQLSNLRVLNLDENFVSDLSPLSNLTRLEVLELNNNSIAELSPLASLERLVELQLDINQISDLAPLENLSGLELLHLRANAIADLSPLAAHGRLVWLLLGFNNINDLSALSELTNVIALDLQRNAISDLSPLKALTGLQELNLAVNSISDISSLEALNDLRILFLNTNKIADLSPLRALYELGYLVLGDNRIENISPLADLTGIRILGLDFNFISDISILENFHLDFLVLSNNSISNIKPLADNEHIKGYPVFSFVDLRNNPLSDTSTDSHVPTIERRGATVIYYDDHGDRLEVASSVAFGSVVRGVLSPYYDIDMFRLEIDQPTDVRFFTTSGALLVSVRVAGTDSYDAENAEKQVQLESSAVIQLHDNSGGILVAGDRSRGREHSEFVRRLEAGVYHIGIHSAGGPLSVPYLLNLIDPREEIVDIPDPNLQAILETALNKKPGTAITSVEMMKLTHLRAGTLGISNLSGLEFATNLLELRLDGNRIEDLTPLAGLVHLQSLHLQSNSIADVSPLSRLTDLRVLLLHNNRISDVSALASHYAMNILYLQSNSISDIGALSEMFWLELLFLQNNLVSDVSPLASLSGLTYLNLEGNAVSDISPLSELTELKTLNLASNSISNISPLSALKKLQTLLLQGNQIRDVSPLLPASSRSHYLYAVNFRDNPLSDESINTHIPALQEALSADATIQYLQDDHGDAFDAATALRLGVVQSGTVDRRDLDYFRLVLQETTDLRIVVSGDGIGARLRTENGVEVDSNRSFTRDHDFVTNSRLDSGTYFLEVEDRSHRFHETPYSVIATEFASSTLQVPLLPSSANPVREGFVRLINRGATKRRVNINAVDDGGTQYPLRWVDIEPGHAMHFNTGHLELGQSPDPQWVWERLGTPRGDWRLELHSDADVEVLAYARTADGFVTAMHDAVPRVSGGFWVPTFNPGVNLNQVSSLRIINASAETAKISIKGVDDAGESPGEDVKLVLSPRTVRTITSQELESGEGELDGALGTGTGKWRLVVDADQPVRIMSLLESAEGHFTNLSTTPRNSMEAANEVLLFPSMANPNGWEGFVRVVNHTTESGAVRIEAVDDSGWDYEPVFLTLDANSAVQFNSTDLELGNPSKNLPAGVGSGSGDWRLTLSSSLDMEVLAYIRTASGFLTSMHDLVRRAGRNHEVSIFNPGGNTNQVSYLRLINPGENAAEVVVNGVDDGGESPGNPVTLSVAGNAVRTLSAQELEWSGEGLVGGLGDGTGKWRLTIATDRPIRVMNLLQSPTGHLTNLSTTR